MIHKTSEFKNSTSKKPSSNDKHKNQTHTNSIYSNYNYNPRIKSIDLFKLTKSLNEIESDRLNIKIKENSSVEHRNDYVIQTSRINEESSNCIEFLNDCCGDYFRKLSEQTRTTPSSTPTHLVSTSSESPSIHTSNENHTNTTNNSLNSLSLSQSLKMRRHTRNQTQIESLKKLRKCIPFYYGIKNHGNTCFINSIIQCVIHSEPLCSYFLNQSNLMHDIKLISTQQRDRSFPLTKSFYYLFNSLWTNTYETRFSIEFRNQCGELNRDFAGREQNDALEFCLWLLNTLNDELALNKYDDTLREYKKFSFIDETFKSKIKSTLTCSQCSYESVKTETYMCVSLPIPQNRTRSLYLNLILSNLISIHKNTSQFRTLPSRSVAGYSQAHFKIGLNVPVHGSVGDVKAILARNFFLNSTNILLVELKSFGIERTLSDCEPSRTVHEDICVLELNDIKTTSESIINIICVNIYKAATSQPTQFRSYMNEQSHNRLRYGLPCVFSIQRDCSYTELIDQIFNTQKSHLKEHNYHKYRNDLERFVRLLLVDTVNPTDESQCYPLSAHHEYPLFDQIVDRVIDEQCKNGGQKHVKLYVEWDSLTHLSTYLIEYDSNRQDYKHQSVYDVHRYEDENESCTLNDCFSLFTQIEELNNENTWLCPKCKIKSNAKKRLCLSSLPEILILNLKRFYQTKNSNCKLSTPVKYPRINLDISKYVDDDLKQNVSENLSSTMYDLYAIANHRGTLTNGHYIAFCKNPIDQNWYSYDDTSVTRIDDSDVCNENAYILFYKRQNSLEPLWWKDFVDEKLLKCDELMYLQKSKSEESFNHRHQDMNHLKNVKLESTSEDDDQVHASERSQSQFYVDLPSKPQISSPKVNIIKNGILSIDSETRRSPQIQASHQNGIERQRNVRQTSDFYYINNTNDYNQISNDSNSYLDNNLIEFVDEQPTTTIIPIRSRSQPPKPQTRTQIPILYGYDLTNDFNRNMVLTHATPMQQQQKHQHQFIQQYNQPSSTMRRYSYVQQQIPITYVSTNGTSHISAYNHYPAVMDTPRQGNRSNGPFGGPNIETTL